MLSVWLVGLVLVSRSCACFAVFFQKKKEHGQQQPEKAHLKSSGQQQPKEQWATAARGVTEQWQQQPQRAEGNSSPALCVVAVGLQLRGF